MQSFNMADSLSNKNLSSHPRQIMKLISTAISELQNNGVYWVAAISRDSSFKAIDFVLFS